VAYDEITPTKVGQDVINATIATLHTVAASSRTILSVMDIANTTANDINVTVYAGEGVASQANTLIPAVLVPANSVFQWTGSQVLHEGDTIQTIASATGCTITASGGIAT
jgi:hypothetical protein